MISEHAYAAEVVGYPDAALRIDGGTIALDAGRSPHVVATSVTCHFPNPADITLLDPRTSPRVRIDVVARLGAQLQARTFDLGVRRRPVPIQGGAMSLTLASDEALLMDWAPLADIDLSALDGRALVNAVLATVISGAALLPGEDFTISLEAAEEARIWKAGVSAWDFLKPLVQAAGLRLVCDGERQWTLRAEDYLAGGMLNIQYGVNLRGGEDLIDRDSLAWYDAAIAIYRWTDGAGDRQERVDSYSETGSYTLARVFEFDAPYPGPGFAEYAVRRARGRGREISFTMRADWTATAEQTVFAMLNDTPYQVGAVQSLSFDLSRDQMSGMSRTLEAGAFAYIVGPVGVSYNDIPVGMSYEEFDWSAV